MRVGESGQTISSETWCFRKVPFTGEEITRSLSEVLVGATRSFSRRVWIQELPPVGETTGIFGSRWRNVSIW